ncbi:MAG: hypothetical protein MJZ06_10215, partial [Bacteroidaceae bacterium]|nr:hypothetical protein [Bacteroidaceae bacterium]
MAVPCVNPAGLLTARFREGTYFHSVSEMGLATHRGVPNGCPVRESSGIAHREGTYFHSVSESGS